MGAVTSDRSHADVTDFLNELQQLAYTAGAEVVGSVRQVLPRLNPATYIGSGKVQILAEVVKEKKADMVIFDDDLSPVQVRNLEKVIDCKLLDRSGLILDIFGESRAYRYCEDTGGARTTGVPPHAPHPTVDASLSPAGWHWGHAALEKHR